MREIKKTSVFTNDLQSLPPVIVKEAWKIVCLIQPSHLTGLTGFYYNNLCNLYSNLCNQYRLRCYLLRVRHRKDIYRKGINL